jgi:hypothetical protein
MNNQEKHNYLIALIKELEKAGNETNLNNFIIVLEDTLKVKYRLRNYFDYPISAADYDELITYAENMLGVNRMGSKDDPHYENLDGIKYEDTKIGAYSCFCINGIQVANYHFNEYEEQYEFYNTNKQLFATITASKVDDKDEWNKLASLFGDAECCVKPSSSGRTTPTSGGPSASIDVDSFNTMTDIEVEALVDYALVDMKLVKHVLKNYTPDQLTIDIIKQAAAGHMVDGVRVNVIDGMRINKQTANYIEMKIKEIQSAGSSDNGLYSDQWIAFTAKQDIKKGDFVLIDEHDNQSVTPAKDMEVSPTTLADLFKEFEMDRPEMKVETTNADQEKRMNDFFDLSDKVMEEYKDAYAALASHDDGYYSGALYNLDDVKKAMEQAQEGYKTIWYFEPFQQFFVGNIRDKADFPFIYLNEDPSHSDYVKHTPVVGPFNSVREMEDYFDLMVHEEAGMYDSDFVKHLRGLVVMIKHYESKDDAHNYSTIIDKLWENLKSFLLGNI